MGQPIFGKDQPFDFYFEEMGLLFGMLHTGKHRPYFKKILEKYYTDTYIYDVTITKFFYWADFFPPEKLLEKYSEIYFFFDAQELDHKEEIIELMGPGVKEELLYNSNKKGDKVFRFFK